MATSLPPKSPNDFSGGTKARVEAAVDVVTREREVVIDAVGRSARTDHDDLLVVLQRSLVDPLEA